MQLNYLRPSVFALSIIAVSLACSLFSPSPGESDLQSTAIAMTRSVLGTQAVLPPSAFQTAIHSTPQISAGTPMPAAGSTVVPAGAAQGSAVVSRDALCYMSSKKGGVISSVKKGEQVLVTGRGGANGAWWSITNPKYQVPCWLEPDVLQSNGSRVQSALEGLLPQMGSSSTIPPGR
jgi:hypothetical protein